MRSLITGNYIDLDGLPHVETRTEAAHERTGEAERRPNGLAEQTRMRDHPGHEEYVDGGQSGLAAR